MVEQIAIAAQVHAAGAVEELRMALQLFRLRKLQRQPVHHLALKRRQRIRIRRVDRREAAGAQRVSPALDLDRLSVKVDAMQEPALIHAVFRVTAVELTLQLEHQNRRRLVHAGELHLVILKRLAVVARMELLAGIVAVAGHSQRGERAQGYAVAYLQRFQIAVLDRGHDDLRNARLRQRRRAHPHDVVVAPLHVDLMVVFQSVHDLVGARAAVKHIADDVQAVNRQRLNHAAQGDDHGIRLAGLKDRLHDRLVIPLFIRRAVVEEHFLNQRAHLAGHRLTHMLARVLDRADLAHLNQPVNRQAIPLFIHHALLFEHGQLLVRIVDQGAEHIALMTGQKVTVQIPDFALDDAAGVMQNMQECRMLAVQVGEKMLRALGQMQDRLQMCDLGRSLLYGSVLLAKQLQVSDVLRGKPVFTHDAPPPFPP